MFLHGLFIHELAEILLINETIDAEEIDIVMQCYENKKRGQDIPEDGDISCTLNSDAEETEETKG